MKKKERRIEWAEKVLIGICEECQEKFAWSWRGLGEFVSFTSLRLFTRFTRLTIETSPCLTAIYLGKKRVLAPGPAFEDRAF